MKRIIFIIFILSPLVVLGATSANYKLDQESVGSTEFDSTSSNYESKAVIGDAIGEFSESTNYKIDQRRIWAVVVVESDDSEGEDTGSSGGGSGGGGGGIKVVATGAKFSGRAYPLSHIDLLKDGVIIGSTVAGPDAQFSITVTGINSGSHTFLIIGRDTDGLRSQSLSFPITVSSGVTTAISGIFLAPTLTVDKLVVSRGDNLAIFGQTAPDSKVTIGIASEHESFHFTDADESGVFLYNFNSALLAFGDHETRAKSEKDGSITQFGQEVTFEVGSRTVLNKNIGCPLRGDLNNDCRVDIVDFSIAAFWYEKPLSTGLVTTEKVWLNGDGALDLVDLSIMAFHWTG